LGEASAGGEAVGVGRPGLRVGDAGEAVARTGLTVVSFRYLRNDGAIFDARAVA